MEDGEFFPDDEIETYADQLKGLFARNAPKRDDDSVPHEIKAYGVVVSPYPGNLRQNGTMIIKEGDSITVRHGYDPAPYALYANKSSRRKNYIEKTIEAFKAFLIADDWQEE